MIPPFTARWFGRRAVGFFGDQVILWNGCYWKRMPMEQDWTRVGEPRYSELVAVMLRFRMFLLGMSILGLLCSGVMTFLTDDTLFVTLMIVFFVLGLILSTIDGRFDD